MEYVRLKGLVELKQGMAINAKSNHLVVDHETSLPLLRIADMLTRRKVVFMDERTPERFWANEEDLVYTRTGQVGLVFRKQRGVVHNNCFRVIPNNPEELDKDYLYWALKLKSVYNYANGIATGAAQPDLPHNSFKTISIPMFDINIQKKIADLLDGFELLIENNNHRIKLLEQMAENLYKEWFVRFRFPGYEDAEFENGLPKGWRSEKLFDVAEVKYGYSFASDEFCEDIALNPVVRIRDVPNNTTKTFTSEKCDDKYLIKENSILVGMDGIFHMCLWSGGTAYLNQRVVQIDSRIDNLCNYLLYFSVYPQVKFWEQTISGTTVAHLGDKHLKKMKVIIPDESILDRANDVINNVMIEIANLRKCNKNLINQRDLLLPRLMSGKLEVK